MTTASWLNGGKWFDDDCSIKKGFICSHKKWNSKVAVKGIDAVFYS